VVTKVAAFFYFSSMECFRYRSLATTLIHAFVIICLTSCKPSAAPRIDPSASESQPVQKTIPEKGVVHASLPAASDAGVTYSIYIPQSCLNGERWPFLILFDPQGKGKKAVNRYKDLAETHGWVLLCSNTSKNGNDPVESNRIIQALTREVIKEFPSDSSRIYTGGFSGGARVAVTAASVYPSMKGIISIGAASMPGTANNCRFIAVAGRQDFNYREVKETEKKLNATRKPNAVLLHNGIHEWAPVMVMDKAMLLLDADAMRGKNLPARKDVVAEEAKEAVQDAGSLERSGDYTGAVDRLAFAKECIRDIAVDKLMSDYYNRLTQAPAFEKNKKTDADLDKEQDRLVSSYLQKVGAPLTEWQTDMKKLNAELDRINGSARFYMLKRVMASLSIQCYMMCRQYMKDADAKKAEYIVSLYKIIDPDNKDAWYYSAILAAKKGQQAEAVAALEASVRNGFTDKDMLMQEPAFMKLHTLPKFSNLVTTIEANQAN
jgi:hypothetical protein